MIAVGSLHESISASCVKQPWVGAQHRHFAIQQYNQAIQCLTDTGLNLLTESVLTCCIIFVMFENLCGRNSEAATHLRSGLSILESWSCQTASQITVKEEYLRPIFTKDYEHVGKVSIPTTFGSVDDARKRLQMLLGDIYAEVNQAIRFGDLKMIRRAATEGMSLLRQWRCRFSTLRAGKDDDSHRAKILARLQVEWGLIMLAAVQLDDECGFDELTDTFRVIVEICEQLTVLESRLLGKEIKSPDVFTYGFDFNVLPPLNITAFKCRDPRIRRRGIALLSAGNRHEALWNFKTVGLLAQKTMELEEAGLRVDSCTDIPIGHRLQLMTVSYSPGVSVEE